MTISPDLFQFLKDLKINNNRDWFNANKATYQEHQEFMKAFTSKLQENMEQYDLIEQTKLHRIYRDIRFSKDKTPYKSHFSGWLKRATVQRRGGYYFHIGPGTTMVAGGFWRPNSPDLKRIRQEIAANDKELRSICAASTFKKMFGTLQGETVKTAPRGYTKDHPSIDLLKMKQFVVQRNFTDTQALKSTFFEEMIKTFLGMRPFFDYMSEVLTTDGNGLPV